MRVLFVTSEVATLFKLGGLADVSYSLPVALRKIGVDITIALPYYASIKIKHVRCLGPLAVSFDRKRELVFIFRATLVGTGVPILLFRHPYLNEYRAHLKDPLLVTRFSFFCQAVATFLGASRYVGESYDVIHCNDWHTGLLPLLLGESPKVFYRYSNGNNGLTSETIQSRVVHTILTVHNPAYHGTIDTKLIKMIALDRRQFRVLADGRVPYVNLLREGLEYADIVTTVSPTFAKEMMRHNYGKHVSSILKKRSDRVIGILNGVDTGLWDPRRDSALARRYGIETVLGVKPKLKTHLQSSLKLTNENLPLFGFVGRLEMRQKGIDLLIEAALKLLPNGAIQFVILGTGSKKVVRELSAVAKKYPDRCAFIPTFDERLARRIYAGADFMLVPSRYEPCGLIQMIAMRYGTIPLVRKTGGLADSVIDGKTGIVFGPYTKTAFIQSIKKAIKIYQMQNIWKQMIRRVMRQDFSWKRSAKGYKRLYNELLK